MATDHIDQNIPVTADLSRLRQIPVRDVWKYEDRDFTTWLLANADVLAGVLGVELEFTQAEHQVGASDWISSAKCRAAKGS